MASDGREIEIKLAIAGVKEGRRLLGLAGFHVWKPRVFERNTIYDTAAADLRRSSRLLRLREIGKKYRLTYKGTPEPGKYKNREEIETDVADGSAFATILERLGWTEAFRYEKFRTEFRRRGSKGIATLDETPIGVYMELEGDGKWIDRMARLLGFEEKDYLTASYARLFLDWKERTGSPASDMLFARSSVGNKRAGQ